MNMDVTYGPEIRFVAPTGDAWLQLAAHERAARPAGGLVDAVACREARSQPSSSACSSPGSTRKTRLFDDGAILVNQRGERFCNERQWPEREIALATQPGKCGYLLLDERLIDRYSKWPHFISTAPQIAYAYVDDYLRLRPDVAAIGSSLAAVANVRGIPAAALEATVRDFNQTAATTARRASRWVLLGPAKAYFTTTEGGAAIDEQLRVLDASGQPIDGLYAVGQNGLGGQILFGHGLHIAWALTSGRLVGRVLGRMIE